MSTSPLFTEPVETAPHLSVCPYDAYAQLRERGPVPYDTGPLRELTPSTYRRDVGLLFRAGPMPWRGDLGLLTGDHLPIRGLNCPPGHDVPSGRS